MTTILVPYHMDEPRTELDYPETADVTITAELPDADPWQRMARLYDQVGDAVGEAVRRGDRPVVLSGDCTTSLGTVTGLQRAGVDPSIVWLDAHGDLQTLETTASGYLGGMPLRVLVGYRPELIAEPLGLRAVAEDRVLLVDARDLDPPEREYLERAAIRRCDVTDLSVDVLPDGPLYLHVDFDVTDPADLPGLWLPVPGGPRLDAVADAVRRVLDSGRVAAFGVGCTWNPGHGAAAHVRPIVASVSGS